MSVFASAARFLGAGPATVRPGFVLSERGVRLPVCQTCGSVVAFEGQRTHTAWHGTKR